MSVDGGENVAALPVAGKRRRWLTVLLATLIFGAGAVCGTAITVAVTVNRLHYLIQHPEEAPGRIATRLGWRLGLDEEQKSKVELIVARRQRELMALRAEIQPRVVDQLELLRGEIADVLTQPQREKWERMVDEWQERWLPAISDRNEEGA